MDPKDIAILLSPIVAILVAIGTIVFNAHDRRRHYALEREKLQLERDKMAREMTKALLSGSKSFERRIDLYNELMAIVSSISGMAIAAKGEDGNMDLGKWQPRKVYEKLEELQTTIRSNQIFTTQFIHESVTRDYSVQIAELANRVPSTPPPNDSNAQELQLASNLFVQIIAKGDELKVKLRDDLEWFIRGTGNLSLSSDPRPVAE